MVYLTVIKKGLNHKEVLLVPLILHLWWLGCAALPFRSGLRPNFKHYRAAPPDLVIKSANVPMTWVSPYRGPRNPCGRLSSFRTFYDFLGEETTTSQLPSGKE